MTFPFSRMCSLHSLIDTDESGEMQMMDGLFSDSEDLLVTGAVRHL